MSRAPARKILTPLVGVGIIVGVPAAIVFLGYVVTPKPADRLALPREQASAAYLRCRDAGGRPDPCEIEAVALIQVRNLHAETAIRAVRDLRASREE